MEERFSSSTTSREDPEFPRVFLDLLIYICRDTMNRTIRIGVDPFWKRSGKEREERWRHRTRPFSTLFSSSSRASPGIRIRGAAACPRRKIKRRTASALLFFHPQTRASIFMRIIDRGITVPGEGRRIPAAQRVPDVSAYRTNGATRHAPSSILRLRMRGARARTRGAIPGIDQRKMNYSRAGRDAVNLT